jgi:hypothetical protein
MAHSPGLNVTPLSDGEAAILNRLADIAQQQAVTNERLIGVLEKVDDHLVRMDSDRIKAVESINGHTTTVLAAHDSWWRKFAIIMGAITAAIAAIGSSLMRLIPFGAHSPK